MKNPNEWKKLKQEVSDAMNKDEELENAVKVLREKGTINSPDVWIKGSYTKNNVRSLVIKVANHIR